MLPKKEGKDMKTTRRKAGATALALLTMIGAGFGLAAVADDAQAWQPPHLLISIECDAQFHTQATVTAQNPEALGAVVLSQLGGAWAIGDVIPASPDQVKHVTITAHKEFRITVNYPPGDTTPRTSNTVSADPIVDCVPPTTVPPTTAPPTTQPPTTAPPTTATTAKPDEPCLEAPQLGKDCITPPLQPVKPATPITATPPHFTG